MLQVSSRPILFKTYTVHLHPLHNIIFPDFKIRSIALYPVDGANDHKQAVGVAVALHNNQVLVIRVVK